MEKNKYIVIFSCVGGILLAVVLLAIANWPTDKRAQSMEKIQATQKTEEAVINQCCKLVVDSNVAIKRVDSVGTPVAKSKDMGSM